MKEILVEYKSTLEKSLDVNNESVRSYYVTCDAIISSCQRELERDNLSFEERKQIVGYMIEVANMKGVKDTENKKLIAGVCVLGVSVIGLTAATLVAALGGNTKIDLNKS